MTTKKEDLQADIVGDEYRDNTTDADYDPGKGRDVFEFDTKAKVVQADHIAVASNSQQLVLEINGTYYDFDPQLAAALRRLVQAGATNLNL